MKKRLLCVLMVFLLSLIGCSSGVSQEKYNEVVAERDALQAKLDSLNKEKEETLDEETMEEGNAEENDDGETNVEILAEYTLADGIGRYTRHFMVVRNNSNETVDVSTSSLAYSSDGALLGADDASFDALGAGCTSVIYEAFEIEAEVDHYETELKSSPSKYYESVIQDLEYVQNDINGGAVFQVTNNGEEPAEFVEGYVLFFLNDKLVGYESTYFTDDDSEIKPGDTISKQLTFYVDYDKIEFYLTGRR